MPFIKVNRLAQLAKRAHSNGWLIVGQMETDSMLVVKTPQVIVGITAHNAPNKYKAMITELIGFVPKVADDYDFTRYSKKDEPTVVDLLDADTLRELLVTNKAGEPYEITALSVSMGGSQYRLLQHKVTGEIKAVNEEYLALIAPEEINLEQEGQPNGPELINGFFSFENSTTKLIVAPRTIDESLKEIINALSTRKIPAKTR